MSNCSIEDLNSQEKREFKSRLYQQFARIASAAASPRRLELIDLLCQGERSVEALAAESQMSVASASQHLQVLYQARLVERRRSGLNVIYRLASPEVARWWLELRRLGALQLSEVEHLIRQYLEEPERLQPMGRVELRKRLRHGDVVLLDVRPRLEYAAGHIPGAVSIPIEELESRLASLALDREIVAYCRGPYCLFAPEAVALLHKGGFLARRLEDGWPEWLAAGLPVEVGEPSA